MKRPRRESSSSKAVLYGYTVYMVQCQQYVFYILFSRLLKEAFTVYMWGPFSPQKHAGGSGVWTPVGAGAWGVVHSAAASACLAACARAFFVAQQPQKGFHFSLHASLYAIYGHVCVHGSLPPPGRFGIWAPSWLNDGTFASLACAYCLALEVCALTCSFTRSHFDWNQR